MSDQKNIVRLLGNGDSASVFNEVPRVPGDKLLICNLPPFAVDNVYAAVMVDFKMMKALHEGSLKLDAYWWILGNRPRKWMEMQKGFYLKYAANIKEFYLHVPPYAGNATDFNCGHMACHYACARMKADEVHLFGLDSLFDFNLRSVSDLYLSSDRSQRNNYRLIDLWRPVWNGIFNEFPNVQFYLYGRHDNVKIPIPDNVKVIAVPNKNQKKAKKHG